VRTDSIREKTAVLAISTPWFVVPFDVKSLRIRIKLREEVRDADGDKNFLARLDTVALKFEGLRRMAYDARRDRMQPQRFEKRAAQSPHAAQFMRRRRAMAECLIDLGDELFQQFRMPQQLVNEKGASARRGVETRQDGAESKGGKVVFGQRLAIDPARQNDIRDRPFVLRSRDVPMFVKDLPGKLKQRRFCPAVARAPHAQG